MKLAFAKMHADGNDFMVVESLSQPLALNAEQISRWGNRKSGIGFDQLLVIAPPRIPDEDFFYQIYNQDGSESSQCGNGARCFAKFIWDRQLASSKKIKLGTRTVKMDVYKNDDGSISVNMSKPQFKPEQIPIAIQPTPTSPSQLPSIQYEIESDLSSQVIHFSALSMGNPHAVLIVDNIADAPLESIGKILQQHHSFTQQVNVGFMEIVNDEEINLRVYERGAGETQSCGSGACAAAICGLYNGQLGTNKSQDAHPTITVNFPSGSVKVQWSYQWDKGLIQYANAILTGSATHIFDGYIEQ